MTPKPDSQSKGTASRPPRKIMKGAAETARLFLEISDMNRRTQSVRLSRYVE